MASAERHSKYCAQRTAAEQQPGMQCRRLRPHLLTMRPCSVSEVGWEGHSSHWPSTKYWNW